MMPDRSPYVSLAQANTLAELVPQAQIAVFPGARHGLPLSHGKEAAATLLGISRARRERAEPEARDERGAHQADDDVLAAPARRLAGRDRAAAALVVFDCPVRLPDGRVLLLPLGSCPKAAAPSPR